MSYTHVVHGNDPQRIHKGILRIVMEEQVIIEHLPLADSIAREFDRHAIDQQETILAARLALVQAARLFEPRHFPHFSIFARSFISGQIQRHLHNHDSVEQKSSREQQLRAEIVREYPVLCQLLGRRPTLNEMAAQLGQSAEAVVRVMVSVNGLQSEAVVREDHSLEGQLLDDGGVFAVRDDSLALVEAVGKLSAQEKKLLCLRYLEQRSQQRIGEEIGASQVQVSHALSRILVRLQHHTLISSPDSAPLRICGL